MFFRRFASTVLRGAVYKGQVETIGARTARVVLGAPSDANCVVADAPATVEATTLVPLAESSRVFLEESDGKWTIIAVTTHGDKTTKARCIHPHRTDGKLCGNCPDKT